MSMSPGSKISSHMAVIAFLHSGLTSVISVVYIVLCILGLVFRNLCEYVDFMNERGAEYFGNILYRVYILDRSCENSITSVDPEVISSDTVFIFLVVILVISICTLISSVTVTTAILQQDNTELQQCRIPIFLTHVGLCIVSIIADLVIGIMFGMDYGNLNDRLNQSSGGLSMSYFIDTLRLGAMLLMTVSLKGYVYHAVNIILMIILGYQIVEHNKLNEHSIHKHGTLNAYEQPRRPNDSWHPPPEVFLGNSRGQQINRAYVHDEDYPNTIATAQRSPSHLYHEPAMSEDYSNRFFSRAESWQGRPAVNGSGSRPFSYLADASPSTSKNPPPPIPAPDYSPITGRRLKSVLKPAYM